MSCIDACSSSWLRTVSYRASELGAGDVLYIIVEALTADGVADSITGRLADTCC